jgi:hypothetical protein
MVKFNRGSWGNVSWGLCAVAAFAVIGCGSSDDKTASNSCGTTLEPTLQTLSNILPAAGSSVPNSAIVHSFTIDGKLLEVTPSFGEAAAHTAGDPIPVTLTWTFAPSADGKSTVYTADPVTWTTAPSHVELDWGGDIQDLTSGCVSYFQNPVFSYDVTAAP